MLCFQSRRRETCACFYHQQGGLLYNGLLTGIPKKTIRQLQIIQNAAARILSRTRKHEHIKHPSLYTASQLHLGLILKDYYWY